MYSDILSHVTGFFRDPEAFETLRTRILPMFKASKAAGSPVRVWVPGCSTGEEVYSIAILLQEILGDSPGQATAQLFGTDVSEASIRQARGGTYTEASLSVSRRNGYENSSSKWKGVIRFMRWSGTFVCSPGMT